MRTFRNMKIGRRLALGFGTMLLLVALIAGVGIQGARHVDAGVRVLYEDNVVPMEKIAEVRALVLRGIFLLRRSGTLLWLLTLAVALSQAWLVWQLAPLKPSVVTLQLAFAPARFWQILGSWGPDGVLLFRRHFAFDHPHTLLYAAWGALVAWRSRLCFGLSARRRWWLVPVIFTVAAAAGVLGLGASTPAGPFIYARF